MELLSSWTSSYTALCPKSAAALPSYGLRTATGPVLGFEYPAPSKPLFICLSGAANPLRRLARIVILRSGQSAALTGKGNVHAACTEVANQLAPQARVKVGSGIFAGRGTCRSYGSCIPSSSRVASTAGNPLAWHEKTVGGIEPGREVLVVSVLSDAVTPGSIASQAVRKLV